MSDNKIENSKQKTAASDFTDGIIAGIPIGLGYFAVAFSLGIVAKHANLTAIQGFIASFMCLASAGEKALFDSIASSASYVEVAIITLVVNARYLLMSCSLSQKFTEGTSFFHRFIVGFGISDELFGIAIAREKYRPAFSYGAFLVAVPMWSFGTFFGVLAGNHLPPRIVSALSVALYGMFLAIVVPPARKNTAIKVIVLSSFVSSFALSVIPIVKSLSAGTRTIALTILISAIAAAIKPVADADGGADGDENKAERPEKQPTEKETEA